jgi:excinuclease ABC subunit C
MSSSEISLTSYKTEDVLLLPHDPGVYRFKNKHGKLIYVGKAKDLKKRVASYFNRSNQLSRKTIKMVSEVAEIEFTIVNSEFDALLLENNLIKENQPKYNILLKDDKTFPYIVILKEQFPRIISTRKVDRTKGEYFGPYTSVKAMKNVLQLLHQLYKIRTCNFDLSPQNIRKKKFKVCLEYHLGNCLGPCEGLQEHNDYLDEINQSKEALKGNLSVVRNYFKERMQTAAEQLAFEEAQKFKNKLDLLEKFQSKSLIVSTKITNTDVFTLVSDESSAFVNYMRVDGGIINISDTLEVKRKLDETDEEILQLLMVSLRTKYESSNKEILTNKQVSLYDETLSITQPAIGDKKKLVDLSVKNALFFKKERFNQKLQSQTKENRVLLQMKEDLKLTQTPMRIECFDNSNIQGTHPVASMVCFINGKAAKKEYRHFNIKTVVGPDDFGSMREIVYRRYKRVIDEGLPLANLIIIDGGKGQLSAAVSSLKELGIYGKVPIIGIAKKLEELYYPEDSIPIHLAKKSESLKIIQQLRDEAHRFAITFHRAKRSKTQTKSALDDIDGIGEKTRSLLLSELKSVEKIKRASITELSNLIGKKKALLVKDHFVSTDTNKKGT